MPIDSDPKTRRSALLDSAPLRLLVLAAICLVLLVPLGIVRSLLGERRTLRADAAQSIAIGWGGMQTLVGPALVVRFLCSEPISPTETRRWRETVVLLPDRLTLAVRSRSERRSRGIHQIPVFSAEFEAHGAFAPVRWSTLPTECARAEVQSTDVVFAFSDPRGLAELSALDWRGEALDWRNGTGLDGVWTHGVSASLDSIRSQSISSTPTPFRFEGQIKGSERLAFVPIGAATAVDLVSDWKTPSFDGAFLPTERRLDSAGFAAHWQVSDLARSIPQSWNVRNAPDLGALQFGARLFVPADSYLMTERSLMYGFLFVALTLLVFYLFELGRKARLHPVHYLLVGGALCVFYLLLLSLSEGRGFGWAYFVAATATTTKISLYAKAILGARRRAVVLAGSLATLYAGLFALIGAEDLALLLGAILLFAAQAAFMWTTRSIDWSSASANRVAS